MSIAAIYTRTRPVGAFELDDYVSIVADNRQPIAVDLPAKIGIVDGDKDWYIEYIHFDRNRHDVPAVMLMSCDGGWLWDHLQYDHRVVERAIARRREEQEND